MPRYQYTLKNRTVVSIDDHATIWSTIYNPITWFAGRRGSALYHANSATASPLGITRLDQSNLNDSLDDLATYATNISSIFSRLALRLSSDSNGHIYMTKRDADAWRRDAGNLDVNWTAFLGALNTYETQLRAYANSGYVSVAHRPAITAEVAQNQSNRAILISNTPTSYVRDGTVFLNALATAGSIKGKR